jgi:hypothetical protein
VEAEIFVPFMLAVQVCTLFGGGYGIPENCDPPYWILGGVGLEIGFSPGEAADFVLGLVGIDIAGDDATKRSPLRIYRELAADDKPAAVYNAH